MRLKISICIPVYNCAEYLGQALDSILPQTDESVEVVVFDGGSTDSTSYLMESYIAAWPNLHYHCSKKRGGIDADMAACVDLAQGEYCWLFSGDDVMRPLAIKTLLQLLEMSDDVYICQHTVCTKQMEIYHDYPVLSVNDMVRANFYDPVDRQQWFANAITTEAFFSFMSSLIVRREKWQEGQLPSHFIGSYWGHVARLFGLASTGLRVCYITDVLLDKRGENDSFADRGIVYRYSIAIDGYHRLGETFWGRDSIEAKHIRRVVRNEFGLVMFLNARIACKKNPEHESLGQLNRLFKKTYEDSSLLSYLLNYAIYRITPVRIYEQGVCMFRKIGRYKRGLVRGSQ